jgi:hypothetical protein
MPNPKNCVSTSKGEKAESVSSPASTGGAGNVFEQAVGAYLLSQLLVGATPPILIDCSVIEISFQNEYRGWHTDDFLLTGRNAVGTNRKLAGQVKRSLTVSSVDVEFSNAILDLWKDFHSPTVFSPERDRFAFVVQLGSNTLLRHFGGLLDCARAATDAEDFEKRLSTPGLLSATAIRYCDEIVTILKDAGNQDIARSTVYPLLKATHIISLDLATGTRQSEVLMKSLLTFAAKPTQKAETAEHTWNDLVVLAAEGATSAKMFRREDLPERILLEYATSATQPPMIAGLQEHTSLILQGIRSTIGQTVHLPRSILVQEVLTELEASRVVLLSGAAGNGKSAVAKEVVTSLGRECFTFAFRAEEFGYPHLDTTLAMAKIDGRAANLSSLLASQGRKIILVESIERLLEKSTRDAFADLLTIVRDDPTYRLVLTCRDYSADLVRAAFLEQFGAGYASVTIPALSDEELDEVQAADSNLAIPLSSSHLRKILANAYVLDKARAIKWSTEDALPASEREFRDLFWKEIVRGDHKFGAGLPQKRDLTFIEIALRRARALSIFASSKELDTEALAGLIQDSLVSPAGEGWNLVAPAHDVLEDWSILKWLDRLYLEVGQNLAEFQKNIGGHPALRRAYRKWMGELLERQPTVGQAIFREAIKSQELETSFADDTLVALLQSVAAKSLIESNEDDLISNDRKNLRRVIHLVRLACLTTPEWARGHVGAFSLPKGASWAALIGVVKRHWSESEAEPEKALLILGLVEDWAKGVSLKEPYPEGAEDVAAIVHELLDVFDGYSHKEDLKRAIQILAKIPKADIARYQKILLTPRQTGYDRSEVPEELHEMLFSGPFYESLPTARDCSPALISALRTHLICTEEDLADDLRWSGSMGTEVYFGLHSRVSHHYFPESGYRTPMLSLLRQHPRVTIEFLIELFNHAVDWYAHSRVTNPLEPAFEVSIILPDGTVKTHWANSRLWQLYRGTSVAPHVLQSYLMALERWLRDLAKLQPDMFDPILVELLSRTDCASIAAVVAAVATAFPLQAGEAILSLLSSKEYIVLDRARMVFDFSPPSQILGGMLNITQDQLYRQERNEADKWPSRRDDLEAAVRNLQMTAFAPRVQSRLDDLRAALGPVESQSDEDRVWRLALHRMDFRGYRVASDAETPEELRKDGMVLMHAEAPDPDIQEFLDRTNPPMQKQQQNMGTLMWAFKAFKREFSEAELAPWRERFAKAREIETSSAEEEIDRWAAGGPAIMAAFVARDYWTELSIEEQDWSLAQISEAVESQADNWNHLAGMQRYEMAPDRSCAFAAVALAARPLTPQQQTIVDRIVPLAVTHPVGEVRWYSTQAAAELWAHLPDLALRCVFAVAAEAVLIANLHSREKRKRYDNRRSYDEMAREAANKVRLTFWQTEILQEKAYDDMQLDEWHGAEAQNKILTILKKAPEHPLASKAFLRAAKRLVSIWDDRHNRNSRQDRNIEADISLATLIEAFVLHAPSDIALRVLEPILGAVAQHPADAEKILIGILHVEDVDPNTAQFWTIWKVFADRTIAAPWIDGIDHRHSSGAEMVHALFLGTRWKETTKHWRSLEGYAQNIHNLFETLAPSSSVIDAYVRFLYHVGEQSLPEAFVQIRKKATEGDPKRLLGNGNTRYRLEVLLQRYVYSKPLLLKEKAALRDAVLMLLDALIDLGSSAAFRMRDDFVTPISA